MRKTGSTITKAYFDGAISSIRGDIRDFVRHFNASQAAQNERINDIDAHLDEVDIKLDAIMESVATRKEMHNLLRELKHEGIKLDSTRIFVT